MLKGLTFAGIAGLALALSFCLTLGCKSNNDSDRVERTTTTIDSSASRDRYDELESSRGRGVIVEVRLATVTPTITNMEGAAAPPVGQSVTARGDIKMQTLSMIQTLTHVGNDFRARANLGSADIETSGRVTRAGAMDRADRDLYRVSLDFRQHDASGTHSQSTTLELPIGESKIVGGMSGGQSIVLTLLRPGDRGNIDSDRRD